jgi:3',5'-cyclic-AMP phosphodiesterase
VARKSKKGMQRRTLLKSIGLTALLSGNILTPTLGNPKSENRKKVLRIAHITDVHVQPAAGAPRGFEKCLRHIQNQKDPVDIIFNGGDAIMDALGKNRKNVSKQWNVWNDIVKGECSLSIESCIGNHDIWARGSKDDLHYGKAWVKDNLQITDTFRSFDRAGWHFIILDSIQSREDGSWYTARLDEDQFDWLKEDLRKVNKHKPVMIMSHVPIVSACAILDGNNENGKGWRIPDAWMHTDAKRLVDLFYKHNNVKLCVSGHIHLLDRVDYNGVSYLCNGAVCGAWWSGKHHETHPGYAIINLYDDGSFDREYTKYS